MDNIVKSIKESINFLLENQNPKGYWIAEYPNVSISTAIGAIIFKEYGKRTEAEKAIDWLLDNQNDDGGWGDIPGRKSNIDCTVCAFAANLLFEDDEAIINEARTWILDHGGFTRILTELLIFPAYASEISWIDIKVPPLSAIYDPIIFEDSDIIIKEPMFFMERLALMEVSLIKTTFVGDLFEKAFIPYAIMNLKRYQCTNGSWFIEPIITGLALLAMKLCDHNDESTSKALNWLINSQNIDGGIQFPQELAVMDTALSIIALSDAGIDTDIPALNKAKDWLLSAQMPNGGWGWTSSYACPDADDTALSVIALSKFAPSSQIKASMEMGSKWIIRRQLDNGSIATFPIDYDGYIKGGLLEFPSVIARSIRALLITGHVKEALNAGKFLMKTVSKEHIYNGADWFDSGLYSWSIAIETILEINKDEDKIILNKLIDNILSAQNENGSWSVTEGVGCVEETALAIKALLLCGIDIQDSSLQKGISYMLNEQNKDGSWNPAPLGILPPINYYNIYWTQYIAMETLLLFIK